MTNEGTRMEPKRQEDPKRYVLVEFPYPSGSGLHMGHAFSFTGGDVYARTLRMQGFDVLFPMGWDSFGLPTENYAIRTGRRPDEVTAENTQEFRRQMDRMRFSFDWDRVVDTSDPAYYRFTQWIFLKLVEHGLAHKREMPINWCPSCKVGLANEEVVDGRCERCGEGAERRQVSQWVVRITAYADRLIDGLSDTAFQESVKAAQINWIGRSEGARVRFPVEAADTPAVEVFTTRPDTLWGATFLVIAPEHPVAAALAEENPEVAAYVGAAARKSDLERTALTKEKTGVATGLSAVNPATGRPIPVWVADFVLASYGTGAVMAVPAHDSRDHEFAAAFGLPIVAVIEPPVPWDFEAAAWEEKTGVAARSGPLDGLTPPEAIRAAVEWLESTGHGQAEVSYHLRDWIFSRQHYWGEPIPMIHCEACGWVPVPEEELPVVLPAVERYQPTDTGESPLASVEEWVAVPCPRCGGPARRETDTMPNWAGSDWYFLRFCDPKNEGAIADMDAMRRWLPVDVYIGGDEHNTLHLLYSRFIYHFLHDIGVVPREVPEPYRLRLSHGVILAADGRRMSKSRGNTVVPDDYVSAFGADAVRTYLMFIGPFDATITWNDRALRGVNRFLKRVLTLANLIAKGGTDSPARRDIPGTAAGDTGPGCGASAGGISAGAGTKIVNRAVRSVTADIGRFSFNTAVAALMETLNALFERIRAAEPVGADSFETFCRLLAPFAPDTAEDAWRRVTTSTGSVHDRPWPHYDPELDRSTAATLAVQVNGKLRGTVEAGASDPREEIERRAKSAGTVPKHIGAGPIQRVIYVPGKMINFVV